MANSKKSKRQKSIRARTKLLLSEREKFFKIYPDTGSHIRALCKLSGAKIVCESSKSGYKCPVCNGNNIQVYRGARQLKCRSCKKKFRSTAGTMFEGVKRPDAWNMAFHFYGNAIPVNSEELASLAGVVQATAFEIIKRVAIISLKILENSKETISSLAFKDSISKRSLLTQAGLKPKDELLLTAEKEENMHHINQENHQTEELLNQKIEKLSADEAEVFNSLDATRISVDELCQKTGLPVSRVSAALTVLELEELIASHAGDQYSRIQLKSSMENSRQGIESQKSNSADAREEPLLSNDHKQKIADCIQEFINYIYLGVSRKYVQLYIAVYNLTCLLKKSEIVHSLKEVIKQSTPITRENIREFNSAAKVCIPDLAA